jgi:hypothetical protein
VRGILLLLGMAIWLAIAILREGKSDRRPYTAPAPDNNPAPTAKPPARD